MNVHKLQDMINGWFIGDFEPSLYRTGAIEVAVKHYRAGDREELHVHQIAAELTVVVVGEVRIGSRLCEAGEIIAVSPGEPTYFEAVTDAAITVVKIPSIPGDKYIVRQSAS